MFQNVRQWKWDSLRNWRKWALQQRFSDEKKTMMIEKLTQITNNSGLAVLSAVL
jgi:hypothetical protein